MRAHDGGVDHHIFVIGVACQQLENSLENAALRPSAKALVHDPPVAKTSGQITPGNARSISVKNRINKQPIVSGIAAHVAFTARQKIRCMGRPSSKPTAHESLDN